MLFLSLYKYYLYIILSLSSSFLFSCLPLPNFLYLFSLLSSFFSLLILPLLPLSPTLSNNNLKQYKTVSY